MVLLSAAAAFSVMWGSRLAYAQEINEEAAVWDRAQEEQVPAEDADQRAFANGFACQVEGTTLTITGNGLLDGNIESGEWEKYREEITKIVLGEGITGITHGVYGPGVTELVLPSTLAQVGYGMDFMDSFDCDTLENIYVDEKNPDFSSQDGILYNKDKTVLVRYPKGKKAPQFTIPSSVTTFMHEAFRGCKNLTSIKIPPTVTEMVKSYGYVFTDCTGLTEVELSTTASYVPAGCFMGCSSLTDVDIPANITSISFDAFKNCSNLKNIRILNRNCTFNMMGGDGGLISETAVIHGYYGSTAHKFAQEYNREFAALEECGHRTVEEPVVPATMTEDGSVPRICKDCGEVLSDGSVICHPGKITLSAADYTYNGKTRHPSVAVKGRDGRVIASSNYKVTYTGGYVPIKM